jgi:exoribonuclease R
VQKQFHEIENDKTIDDGVRQYMYFKGRRMQESAGYMLYHDAVKDILEKTKKGPDDKEEKKLKNVHFALGEDFYTHFTSPMRRMADIMVHETLNSLIYKTEAKQILPE